MKKRIIALLIPILTILVTISSCTGCAMLEDKRIRDERIRVHELIRVGQNIDVAQKVLKANGYKLVYEKPIDQTGLNETLTQLVVIGDTTISTLDGFLYAAQLSHPIKKESPYLVIDADIEGNIYRIE